MTNSICLASAPVATDFEDAGEAQTRQVLAAARSPKLGVLALAAVLEQAGLRPTLFDVDDAYHRYLADGHRGLGQFPAWAGAEIISSGAQLIGLSSLCSSYPITIRIAEAVKRRAPGCTILLGGPQASVVDLATLSAFPFVDFILRGEADVSLPVFVEEWSGRRCWSEVPGLTWRSPFGPQRNPDAPVIQDLDALPLPAYHLSQHLKNSDYAFLELGRGCPFACTFCSTNDFFRRKFRLKSPQRILEDMRLVGSVYEFRGFNLVHDMFTVDRRKVVAFCEAMIESGEGFKWSCSARTDCIDAELLELMARAGCNGVFFGVEAGSRRMQKIIDKGLDPDESRRAVETAERFGIPTTVSLITGFPEETEQDHRETIEVYMHSLRHPNSTPQLNILAPLAGTPIYTRYKDGMFLDELASQVAYPGRTQSDADRKLVRDYPHIFPNFYLLPMDGLDRALLVELAEFMPMCRKRLRWLAVALHQHTGDILCVFRAWREYRKALHPEMTGSSLRQFYTLDQSKVDFLAFVRSRMHEFGTAALEALIKYEETLAQAIANAPLIPAGSRVSKRIVSSSIPVRAPGVHVVDLDFDIQSVIDSLKREAAWIPRRAHRRYCTADSSPTEMRLIEITPLASRALRLCNGTRTVDKFGSDLGPFLRCPRDLRRYAAGELLRQLRRQHLVDFHLA